MYSGRPTYRWNARYWGNPPLLAFSQPVSIIATYKRLSLYRKSIVKLFLSACETAVSRVQAIYSDVLSLSSVVARVHAGCLTSIYSLTSTYTVYIILSDSSANSLMNYFCVFSRWSSAPMSSSVQSLLTTSARNWHTWRFLRKAARPSSLVLLVV